MYDEGEKYRLVLLAFMLYFAAPGVGVGSYSETGGSTRTQPNNLAAFKKWRPHKASRCIKFPP